MASIVLALLFSRSAKWSEVLVVARVSPRNLRRQASTIIARHAIRRNFPGSLLDSRPNATAFRADSATKNMSSQVRVFACRAPELTLAAVVKR